MGEIKGEKGFFCIYKLSIPHLNLIGLCYVFQLLERVTVYEDQVKIELRSAGMKHLIEEFKKYA